MQNVHVDVFANLFKNRDVIHYAVLAIVQVDYIEVVAAGREQPQDGL